MFILFSVLFILVAQVRCDSKLNEIAGLISEIVNAIKAYQILLLVNDDEVSIEMNDINKLVLQHFPTIMIEPKKIGLLGDIMDFPAFGSPRSSSLFVQLHRPTYPSGKSNLSEISSLFDSYIEIMPRPSRPRWLIILESNEIYNRNETIELFLRDAWRQKFLDVTVLELDVNHTIIHRLNPFTDLYEIEVPSETSRLFPNKLLNMNGYNLTTLFGMEEPTSTLKCDESGRILSVTGIDFWIVDAVATSLNFSLRLMSRPQNTSSMVCSSSIDVYSALYGGEIDFGGNRIYMWQEQPFERSTLVKSDGYCALVPILPRPTISETAKFYYGLIWTSFGIFMVLATSKVMKFDKRFWTWLSVFSAIFGFPVPRHPRVLKERMLFGCVMVLSFWYATMFYARLTDKNLRDMREVPLCSFQDLDNSGLTPLVESHVYNFTFDIVDHGNPFLKSLKRKAKFWVDSKACVDELRNNRKVACIFTETLAYFAMARDRQENAEENMRIMRPCFWITWKGFAFAAGSPYVQAFDRVLLKIFDSGLILKWINVVDSRRSGLTTNEAAETYHAIKLLIFVLLVGYGLSLLAFLVEIYIATR